jgi:hypothetical protein
VVPVELREAPSQLEERLVLEEAQQDEDHLVQHPEELTLQVGVQRPEVR